MFSISMDFLVVSTRLSLSSRHDDCGPVNFFITHGEYGFRAQEFRRTFWSLDHLLHKLTDASAYFRFYVFFFLMSEIPLGFSSILIAGLLGN